MNIGMPCLQYSKITYRRQKCDIGNLSWWRSHDNSVSRWVILTVRIFIMLQWAILFIRRQLYNSSNKGTWYQIAKHCYGHDYWNLKVYIFLNNDGEIKGCNVDEIVQPFFSDGLDSLLVNGRWIQQHWTQDLFALCLYKV